MREYRTEGLVFVDHGGPYIEVCLPGRQSGPGERTAIDCINAWDYETGARSEGRPYTASALRTAAHDWLRENRESIPDYIMAAGR